MNLCHHVDLVRNLAGLKAESVVAIMGNLKGLSEVEDHATLNIHYAGGAVGSFSGSISVPGLRHESVSIWGRDGSLELGLEFGQDSRIYTRQFTDALQPRCWIPLRLRPRLLARAIFFGRFADAVSNGRPPDVTAQDGLAVQAVLEAAYRAAETGRAVRPADLVKCGSSNA